MKIKKPRTTQLTTATTNKVKKENLVLNNLDNDSKFYSRKEETVRRGVRNRRGGK